MLGYCKKMKRNLEITVWLAIVRSPTVNLVKPTQTYFFSKYIKTMYIRSTVPNMNIKLDLESLTNLFCSRRDGEVFSVLICRDLS